MSRDRREIRPFNPSNEPDTCLYCGVSLKRTVWKERRYSNTVTLCCQAPVIHNGAWRWANVPEYACSICKRELRMDGDDTETLEHVTPERTADYAGVNGHFCTQSCTARFGLLAAEKGVRYRRAAPQEE